MAIISALRRPRRQAKRASPGTPRDPVGVIGLGIMGSAMATNIAAAGFPVVGYDLLPKRRSALTRAGGRATRSAGEVARRAPVAITSLPSAEALRDVATEIARVGRRGLVVIETSTLPVAVKEEARDVLARRGVTLLDCPLSGTGAQAKLKDLVVFASGDRAAYRRCVPVLEAFARAHYFLGAFGAGSKMKFVANLLVAIHNVSAAEALVLGMKAGLDPGTMVQVLSDGAGSSRMLQIRGPMMVKGDYSAAAMKVGVWQKDMRIIGEFARGLDCPTPLFAATTPIYNAAMALGFQASDTAAVCAVLERWASLRRRS
jgi:3-hydroxyisobutyrate dehydrogenase-like beta-hydroxyacid dehydrogenase